MTGIIEETLKLMHNTCQKLEDNRVWLYKDSLWNLMYHHGKLSSYVIGKAGQLHLKAGDTYGVWRGVVDQKIFGIQAVWF